MASPPKNLERAATTRRRVRLFTFPGGNGLDVAGPFEVFASANRFPGFAGKSGHPPYDVRTVAVSPGPVRMHSGLSLFVEDGLGDSRDDIDTLIVCGGDIRTLLTDRRISGWLRDMQPRVRRMASVCTGSFLLAAAGVLGGRRATTHWAYTDALAQRFPDVSVEPDALFIKDGNIYTSAGVTAGMDLALALVEEDLGHEIALWVARQLVLFLKRPGGQSQFSSRLAAQSIAPGCIADLMQWIVENLRADLSVDALARRAAMSPRNFARVFARETGSTPAKFVESARMEEARRLLEEACAGIDEIASTCGFGNAERMRRTFLRHLRVAPHEYRRRFETRAADTTRRKAS